MAGRSQRHPLHPARSDAGAWPLEKVREGEKRQRSVVLLAVEDVDAWQRRVGGAAAGFAPRTRTDLADLQVQVSALQISLSWFELDFDQRPGFSRFLLCRPTQRDEI